MTLKERISQFRKENHITHSEFAKLCGVDRATIYRIEHGGNASELTIGKIEKVIGKGT